MTEPRRPEEPLSPVDRPSPESQEDDDRQKKRDRARALIIGSLTAGGMFQLNGWQAQAHGNRSSHSASAFQSTLYRPEDYVLLRQKLQAPTAKDTIQLLQAREQLRTLFRKGPAAFKTPEFTRLTDIQLELETKLQVGTTTRQSLTLLSMGDAPGAIAAIEGLGNTEAVLNEYVWSLLDIAYLGRDGDKFNAGHIADFAAIARGAVAFIAKTMNELQPPGATIIDDALRVKSAEVLHNIASFTLPDDGLVPDEVIKLGRDSADQALAIRIALKQPFETMIAHWMVGKHKLRAKDFAGAVAAFDASLKIANEIDSQEGRAWGTTYRLQALKAAGAEDDAIQTATDTARAVLQKQTQSSILIDLLRIDQGLPD